MNRQTPYNTGKVLIGCRYEPPKPDYMGRSGEFWQSVLLGIHHERRKERWRIALYLLIGYVIVGAMLAAM